MEHMCLFVLFFMHLVRAEILEIFQRQQVAKEAIREKGREELEEESTKAEKLREMLRYLLVE
jgi:hypothetical protein